MRGALTILLVGVLLTSSFVGQVSSVFGDPNSEKQNASILKFNDGVVLSSSSTTTICHVPPGNHAKAHTIIVGTSSLSGHFKNHDDNLGDCDFEKLNLANDRFTSMAGERVFDLDTTADEPDPSSNL